MHTACGSRLKFYHCSRSLKTTGAAQKARGAEGNEARLLPASAAFSAISLHVVVQPRAWVRGQGSESQRKEEEEVGARVTRGRARSRSREKRRGGHWGRGGRRHTCRVTCLESELLRPDPKVPRATCAFY